MSFLEYPCYRFRRKYTRTYSLCSKVLYRWMLLSVNKSKVKTPDRPVQRTRPGRTDSRRPESTWTSVDRPADRQLTNSYRGKCTDRRSSDNRSQYPTGQCTESSWSCPIVSKQVRRRLRVLVVPSFAVSGNSGSDPWTCDSKDYVRQLVPSMSGRPTSW